MVSTTVSTAVPADTSPPSGTAVSTPGPVGAVPPPGGAPPASAPAAPPPPAALSRSVSEPADEPPPAGPPNCTTPANGAFSVNASTVDFARSYAACTCARCAAVNAAMACPTPASPCCTEAMTARAEADASWYAFSAAFTWASSASRTAGSVILPAASRAALKAAAAAWSVWRCRPDRSVPVNPPPPPLSSAASACAARSKRC